MLGLMGAATVDLLSAESLPTTTTEHRPISELTFFLLRCLFDGNRLRCQDPLLQSLSLTISFHLPPRNGQQSNGPSPILLRGDCIKEPQSLLTTVYACVRQRQRGRGRERGREELANRGREILALFKAQAPTGVMEILSYIYC